MAEFRLKDGRTFRAFSCDDEQVIDEMVRMNVIPDDWREKHPLLSLDYNFDGRTQSLSVNDGEGVVLAELEIDPDFNPPEYRSMSSAKDALQREKALKKSTLGEYEYRQWIIEEIEADICCNLGDVRKVQTEVLEELFDRLCR